MGIFITFVIIMLVFCIVELSCSLIDLKKERKQYYELSKTYKTELVDKQQIIKELDISILDTDASEATKDELFNSGWILLSDVSNNRFNNDVLDPVNYKYRFVKVNNV